MLYHALRYEMGILQCSTLFQLVYRNIAKISFTVINMFHSVIPTSVGLGGNREGEVLVGGGLHEKIFIIVTIREPSISDDLAK